MSAPRLAEVLKVAYLAPSTATAISPSSRFGQAIEAIRVGSIASVF
ncbi:MAG: hypothetical protein U0793_15795 [Gemmataceae bacterium]